MGGIANVITNTVVRSLTKKALGKATKSAGYLAGKKGKKAKKGEKTGGNKKKGAARGKELLMGSTGLSAVVCRRSASRG